MLTQDRIKCKQSEAEIRAIIRAAAAAEPARTPIARVVLCPAPLSSPPLSPVPSA